ncbi:unnamed protein product [Paramecium octaurelia]|uniref:Poly [ADP-ribose] polymerase n=1 Tax=Paramecium octaurelia TaxID=43137 RepID=A0A8S1VU07_PAROT|nr:unnamed protein product [Paramecium octaurelia]
MIESRYNVLKQIQNELDNECPNQVEFLKHTYDFYCLITHYFEQNKVPLIYKNTKVQSKLDMLETLQYTQIVDKILQQNKNDQNQIDEIYKKLNFNIQYIEHNSEKVKLINIFKHNTQSYSCKLEVKHVFELTKQQDDKRFKKDLENRMLFFNGSKSINIAALLEAPITTYRFGKGIYFTDVVEKAVSYGFTDLQTNSIFILLCDMALGNTVIKFHYDCNAGNLPMENHSTCGKARFYPPENLMLKCQDCLMQKFQLVCLNLQTFRIHLGQSAMNLQFMMMLESGQSIQSN